jgi:heavy metal translocating P-type ATPase
MNLQERVTIVFSHTPRLVASVAGLGGGIVAWLLDADAVADGLWIATTFISLIPLAITIVLDLLQRKTGVDVIALLAMVSALIVGEYLAAAVIAVMLATGGTLEEYAGGRAQRELRSLLQRAPRTANRYDGSQLNTVAVDEVQPGDRLLVRSGEVIPADGAVASDAAVLDESALTGEPGPVERARGDSVLSGAVNAGAPFDLYVTAPASESTYAGIIRLVQEAEQSQAPFVRLADRYAFIFLPLTLVIAGGAWLISGDPVRFVAVLVVATPCPLILAAPIAIVSGVSRSARRGIVVKGGRALEALTHGRVLLFDKTGTLTRGAPEITEVETHGDHDERELLRLAASLNQASPHVIAASMVRTARERGIELVFPEAVHEEAGAGVEGRVDGCLVRLGRADWVGQSSALPDWATKARRRASLKGAGTVFASVDGGLAGVILVEDVIRPDSARTIRSLRSAGIDRIVMVTGDRAEVAESVGLTVGVDQVLADRSPAEKVDAVKAERARGRTIMVGDGINDAPALASADVGVAMGARGASASSEAADVVLVVDRLERLAEAIRIARRARGIALQAVLVGMGLSLVAMGVAAAGYLPPVAGAILQEGIDLLAIAIALRALGGYEPGARIAPEGQELGERFRGEHTHLTPQLNEIRAVADRLDTLEPAAARRDVEAVYRFLQDELVPHELAEEAELYPAMAEYLGGEDPVGPMIRAHAEISHLTRVLGQILEDIGEAGPGPEDLTELRRVLYGLHAILLLHFAQEEEAYLSRLEA